VEVASYLVFTQMHRSSMPRAHMREWWDILHVVLPAGHRLCSFGHTVSHLSDQNGVNVQTLHVCRAGCILFRDRDPRLDPHGLHQFADADQCPRCGLARYKNVRKKRAYKTFTWLGINTQLARRAWHPAWRDAVRIPHRVNCILLYTFVHYSEHFVYYFRLDPVTSCAASTSPRCGTTSSHKTRS
jgi:hypothetical protein